MYRIIGADGQQYGPVTAEQVREWIASGRAHGPTMAQAEGATDWTPLSSLPEFADSLAAQAAAPAAPSTPPVMAAVDPDALASEILGRDFNLDIVGCLTRAWEKVKSDFWPIVGVNAVVLLLMSVSGAAYVAIFVVGPLLGGLYWYGLKVVRGQKVEMGDVFAGFSMAFLQLLVAGVVSGLLTGIGVALCIIPGIYLGVAWQFTLPLIMDKRLEFWPAMELSRRVISRHWWNFFGLAILSGLLNLAGAMVCCVGVFITFPVTTLALMYAYEDIFAAAAAQPAIQPV